MSAYDSDLIPHSVTVPVGTAFGPYSLADASVNLPRDQIGIAMAVPVNGVRLTFGTAVSVHVTNPPVPSATEFNLTADVTVDTPVVSFTSAGGIAQSVGLPLATLPDGNVHAHLTSGNPIAPITLDLVGEYVHARYTDGTIPNMVTQSDQALGPFTADAFFRIYDDASDANHRIEVTTPALGSVQVGLPFYLQFTNAHGPGAIQPLSPFGVVGRITMTTALVEMPGSITADLPNATFAVESLAPAPGVEGTNYTADAGGATAFGVDLEQLLKDQLVARAGTIAGAIGSITVVVPTVAEIEDFIAAQAHGALVSKGNLALWQPNSGGSVELHDVTPQALADALAIAMNAGAAPDPAALANFIPSNRQFAVAIDGQKVLAIVDEQIHRPEAEHGFGPNFPPKTFDDINGHTAVLNSLTITLIDGSIHMEGDVTVVNAVAGSIDVGASFAADAGLQWDDNADGTQMIQPFLIGDPDVDLSLLAWILSFLIGFITLGLVGGIVALVVVGVAEGVAQRVGGAVIRDDVTNQVRGVGAWPQQLEGVGTIDAKFENPIIIDHDGIVFAG
ncbi:MAG: hypothetical protein ACXV8L_00975 [Ilumatobacteraceae bacterium]